MVFSFTLEEAERYQLEEDRRGLDSERAKIGEGGNTSAHLSSRGYVVKTIEFDEIEAQNPCNAAESPFDQAERIENIDRFPWAELKKLDMDHPSDRALVRMNGSDMSHEEAVELQHISNVIWEDLDMFFELRDEGITYGDLKPENIGYFWTDDMNRFVAKPIDVFDGKRKPWSEEEDISYRKFSDILDVYIRGTPDEDGLVDLYTISTPEAERYVMDYLGLGTENITGDPYKDFFQTFDESEEYLGDVLSY